MHLRAGVVQGRYAQEHIVVRLAVMLLLHPRRVHKALMLVQNGLWEASGAGREIDGGEIVVGNRHVRTRAGFVGNQMQIVLGIRRAAVAHVKDQLDLGNVLDDFLHAANELRPEKQRVRVGQIQTIANFLRRVAEIQRHGQRAGLQRSKVNRQPLDAVHHQNGDLVALFDAASNEQIRAAVCLFIEYAPRDFPPVRAPQGTFDQLVFLPRGAANLLHLRVQLHKRGFARVFDGVFLQKFGNGHADHPFCVLRLTPF